MQVDLTHPCRSRGHWDMSEAREARLQLTSGSCSSSRVQRTCPWVRHLGKSQNQHKNFRLGTSGLACWLWGSFLDENVGHGADCGRLVPPASKEWPPCGQQGGLGFRDTPARTLAPSLSPMFLGSLVGMSPDSNHEVRTGWGRRISFWPCRLPTWFESLSLARSEH